MSIRFLDEIKPVNFLRQYDVERVYLNKLKETKKVIKEQKKVMEEDNYDVTKLFDIQKKLFNIKNDIDLLVKDKEKNKFIAKESSDQLFNDIIGLTNDEKIIQQINKYKIYLATNSLDDPKNIKRQIEFINNTQFEDEEIKLKFIEILSNSGALALINIGPELYVSGDYDDVAFRDLLDEYRQLVRDKKLTKRALEYLFVGLGFTVFFVGGTIVVIYLLKKQ